MSSNNAPPLVKGEILIDENMGSFTRATVYIYLEDVSYLDTSAKITAKQVILDINHQMGTQDSVKFALKGEIPNMQATYSIRVHIALHQNEQIHRGDYITVESYPVLTFGYPNNLSIRLREVK